jgi:hypothetical protein
MEEDIHDSILERRLPKDKLIETRLEKAISRAQEILDYESAHNTEILQALDIVKNFIQMKKRVCYGGTAMNALLPEKDKFYSSDYDLPDYDFLTPDANNDVKELVNLLKNAGYNDVYNRVGVHEGTKKILVNYVAVADITEVEKDIYDIYVKHSKNIDGILYTNENMLRMMMYLELSRPRGEVERWKKVFKRLQLLNKHFPVKKCTTKHFQKEVNQKDKILNFVISRQRVLANLELENIYRRSLTSKNITYSLSKYGPLLFYSPDIRKDAFDLKHILQNSSTKLIYYNGKGDFLPSRVHILQNSSIVAILIEESACHSFNNIPMKDKRIVHIASLESIITLHLSFHYFNKFYKTYLCDIGNCIRAHELLAGSKKSILDAFPINCSGYQKGYPTLLREKVVRIQEEKSRKEKRTAQKKNSTMKKKHGT